MDVWIRKSADFFVVLCVATSGNFSVALPDISVSGGLAVETFNLPHDGLGTMLWRFSLLQTWQVLCIVDRCDFFPHLGHFSATELPAVGRVLFLRSDLLAGLGAQR